MSKVESQEKRIGSKVPNDEEGVWKTIEADMVADGNAKENIGSGVSRFQGLNIPTKTKETEERYGSLAKRLITQFKKLNGGNECFDSEIFVNWLIAQKPKWSKSTWRQYKASIMFYLSFTPENSGVLSASKILEESSSDGCLKKALGGSAGRIKNCSSKEYLAFIKALSRVPSDRRCYLELTTNWMVLGSITGLRPHEWGQAALIRNLDGQSELVGIHGLTPGRTYLRVKNSKHTNGRANGEYRHLDVSEFSEKTLWAMDALIMKLSDRVRYPALYSNCRRFIADANRYLFGNDTTRRFHLYSARHRFASEAKKQLSRELVAAAMGHGNDHTAFSTYGNSRHSSGGRIAKPVEGEAATVKRVSELSGKFLNKCRQRVSLKK